MSALTGALLGGVVPAAFILTYMAALMAIGRMGPDEGIGNLFALLFLGAIGVAFGTLVGWVVHLVVSRTRLAGPVDRRLVAIGLVLAAVIATVPGVLAARRAGIQSMPRVI